LKLVLATPLAAFLVFFMFKATEACIYGSLRAPLYIAAVYSVVFLAARRFKWVWRKRAASIIGACHTCLSLSLTIRANFASSTAPMLPFIVLAAAVIGYLLVSWRPSLSVAAVLDKYAVFTGSRLSVVVFFRLYGSGDVDVLLGEAWSRGVSFAVERLSDESFLSLVFDGFSFGGVTRVAEEKAGWIEGVLRRAGFKPQRVEGWIEVEKLLYATMLGGWEAAAFVPCREGWRTLRLASPSGRRSLALAVRRRFEPSALNPQPQALLKSFIKREEVLEVV